MELAILARHGESEFSARGLVNGDLAVACPLTRRGEEEARRLGDALADEPIDLCVTSEFERAKRTAELALGGRHVPLVILPELNDPQYGAFEGGSLQEYREWAWSHGSGDDPPGGGESRVTIVSRYARAFRTVLERPEQAVLAVSHSLPMSYALSAEPPAPRVPVIDHARPYRLTAAQLETAVDRMERWCAAPTW